MTIQTTTTEQELLSEIAESERTVAEKESVVNDLKEQMKLAKEEYEGAVYKLRSLCRQQENDADRPLLNGDNGGILDRNDIDITLSAPGLEPVTVTGKQFSERTKAIKKAARNGKAKKKAKR